MHAEINYYLHYFIPNFLLTNLSETFIFASEENKEVELAVQRVNPSACIILYVLYHTTMHAEINCN